MAGSTDIKKTTYRKDINHS